MKKIKFNLNHNKFSNKFWLLSLLCSGTLFNYSILAAIDHTRAIAGDLEFDTGSYVSPPNGPTLNGGAASLRENTVNAPLSGGTFVAYPNNITMSVSLTSIYTDGLTIGATGAATNKGLTAVTVFGPMNQYGGATSATTNAFFTSTPNSPVGTGISTTDNYAFLMFASVEPLFNASSTPTNGRFEYGTITVTFNKPVSNPVIQMTGMGGTTQGSLHGHSAEFELQTTGITASKLSGNTNLSVTSAGVITNTATTITASCTGGAACGSVQFTGTNITKLTFKVFVRGDGNGTPKWSQTGTVNTNANGNNGDAFLFGGASIALPVTVSGKVLQDANGSTDSLVNGSGTNAGGLSANLVDGNNKVVATSIVAADGTYSFLAIGAGTYTVSLSTVPGVQGTTAPAINLPANWVNTGEGTTTAGDGTVDGKTAITVGTAAVSGINFGIEQLPTTTNLNPSSQLNPGGTATVNVTTLAGTDPEDGALGAGKTFKIVTLPANGTLYYLNASNVPVLVTANQVISNYDPNKLKLDPNDGAISVSFTYLAIDAAGKESPNPATVIMPFSLPSISGKIWNDVDGSGLGGFNLITTPPGELGTNAGGLYAILIDGSPTKTVIASVVVNPNGTYTFPGIAQNQTGLTIELSTTPGTPGSTTIPTPGIPANWKSTTNTLINSIKQPITVPFPITTTDITDKDFGIAQSASVILVKRITGIKAAGGIWNHTLNPRDNTPLNQVVSNPAEPANTNYLNPKWFNSSYVKGAPNGGKVFPGDEIEYTIYYLNTQGANASSLKICDPIRGNQKYNPETMKLSVGGATAIGLSDIVGGGDLAHTYGAASSTAVVAPTDCNISSATTNVVRNAAGIAIKDVNGNDIPTADNGGVAIQIVGTNGSFTPAAIPGATSAGMPANSYGFFRFTTKVNP